MRISPLQPAQKIVKNDNLFGISKNLAFKGLSRGLYVKVMSQVWGLGTFLDPNPQKNEVLSFQRGIPSSALYTTN